MLKLTISAAVVFVMLNVVPAHSETFKAKQGDAWLGGDFSFSSIGFSYDGESSDERLNLVMLSPIARFFPADYFSIGPKISWTGVFPSDGYNANVLGLGGELGYVYGGSIIPYFFVGSQALLATHKVMSYSYNYPVNSSTTETISDWSYSLPLSLGVVIPVAENLGLQFEFCFQLGLNEGGKAKTNQIFIGLGVCGLGKKVAISALSSMGLTSLIGM